MSMSSSSVLTLPLFDTLSMRAHHNRGAQMAAESHSSLASLRAAKNDAERQMILEALAAQNGNRTRAAKALGISRAVFYRKLAKYGLDPEELSPHGKQ